MTEPSKTNLLPKALLTLGVFEFFGPVLRDIGDSHLLNPEWVGHARFHLMWFLVFIALSGIANLALIWKIGDRRALLLAWVWQAINIAAFWGAAALSGVYGGRVVDASFHTVILGLNENLFVFVVLVLLSAVTFFTLPTSETRSPSSSRVPA